MKLIILGNGFDLAHDLKTSFNDFRIHLVEKNKKDLVKSIDKMFADNNYGVGENYNWNQIEELMYKEFKRTMSIGTGLDELEDLVDEFTKEFHLYLESDVIPLIPEIKKNKNVEKYMTEDSVILNFNFTNLWQNYLPNSTKIRHVHGNIVNDERIIIGFYMNNYLIDTQYSDYQLRYNGNFICKQAISYKNNNKELMGPLKGFASVYNSQITEIVVIGYSFGASDTHIFPLLETMLKVTVRDDNTPYTAVPNITKVTVFDYKGNSEEIFNKLKSGLENRKIKTSVNLTGNSYGRQKQELFEFNKEKYDGN